MSEHNKRVHEGTPPVERCGCSACTAKRSGTWQTSRERRNELLRIKRATGTWSDEEYREFKMICKTRKVHEQKLRALGFTRAQIRKQMA